MAELPGRAKALLYLAYLLGAAGLVYVLGYERPGYTPMESIEIFLFLVLGILAGGKKVVLLRIKGKEEVGSMSLGFAIIFAAMIRFDSSVAVLVGVVSTLSSCLYPKRFPNHQTLFNVGVNIFSTICASEVMRYATNGNVGWRGLETFPVIVLGTLMFFFINTGFVAAIITLAQGKPVQSMGQVWQETFLWTAPSYFLGSGVSSLAVAILGQHIAATLSCIALVAYFTHISYSRYMERTEALLDSKQRLADLYLATVRSLALAIDAKDQYTHQHILRVQRYAVAIARKMGISGEELVALETAALLHDIGKLGVPEYVLLKPGRLTDEEFAKIKEHPRIGADILDPVPFPWPVVPGVKHHHEKWDGTGYPDRLAGEDIPLQGRILAVADVYDALTSNRSYRAAWTHEKAVAEIRDKSGSHFDPRIVEAFLAVIEDVVTEMAAEGIGPCVVRDEPTPAHALVPQANRADVAARDIHRASSELWALYEVAQSLSCCLGLEETLDLLGRKLAAILPGTCCLFLLRNDLPADGSGGAAGPMLPGSNVGPLALDVRVAVGMQAEVFQGTWTAGPTSLSLQAARSGEIYHGAFDRCDLTPPSPESPDTTTEPLPFQNALIIPIIHQGEALGTINLYRTECEPFSSYDRQLLEMVADRAALAIYNGILFNRTVSQALTDPLTGLANIRYLTQRLEQRCGIAEQPFTLLCLDLDSFKPINDNFGHQRGDQVLKDLAEILRQTMRGEDLIVRYGGDEFLILAEGVTSAQAASIVQRLHEAVTAYDPGLVHERAGSLRLGASIGAAYFPEDGTDAATLISRADQRMYRVKGDRKLFHLCGTPAVSRGRQGNTEASRSGARRNNPIAIPPGELCLIGAPDAAEKR
ncbi:MAG: hypothetical protein OHK0029_13820 [Armatimonadaceae bacterium]